MLVGADARFRQDTLQNCPGQGGEGEENYSADVRKDIFSVKFQKHLSEKNCLSTFGTEGCHLQ